MTFDDTDLIGRLHAVAEAWEMPAASPTDDLWRGRRRLRRNRLLQIGVAAATVAVVLGITIVAVWHGRASDRPEPIEPPRIIVSNVPVWYDASGLHRGDVVERTPVDLVVPERTLANDQVLPEQGALTLVRSGALYVDPATRDVWFHPWGGEPRIVGHHSAAGPGGDPNGDTAAWFERSELVVYDTAAGRQISRTTEMGSGAQLLSGDHRPQGNSFLQVSDEQVVWRSDLEVESHDVRTGRTTGMTGPGYLVDLHDQLKIFGDRKRDPMALVLRVPGQADRAYPELEWTRGRLSPSGGYILGVKDKDGYHGAEIVDIGTGEVWTPRNAYPWIAWSYGDIAMVDTEDDLLACDAARRTCKSLPAKRPFLMPTN